MNPLRIFAFDLLAATGLSLVAAVVPALADDAAPAPVAVPDGSGDAGAIVVTGNRGRKPRTLAQSPVPIDVLAAQDLRQTGRTGLKEILANLVPSLTMPALGGGGTSASVKPIAIRGLSGDYVLVLVNGKRRHTTALINNLSRVSGGSTPVDLDLIPTDAVGHIEVLRDGAAAQYGSDAISGVINVILDHSATGGDISFTGGQTYSKGAPLYQLDADHGFRLGDGGFVHIALEAKYHDRSKSVAEPVPYVLPLVNGAADPRDAGLNHVIAGGYGRSNRDKIIAVSYDAELPVSAGTTLYSFTTYAYRDIKDARGAAFPAPTGYGGQTNTQASAVLPQVYPDGFQAYRRIWENDAQLTFGARGTALGWSWDASSAYGIDHVRLGAENTLNPSLGPTSPTRFYMGTQIQQAWLNNLDLTRDLAVGLAAPLTLAVGGEHRWEKFQNKAGEPDSYINGGYQIPADGSVFGTLYGGRYPSPGLVSFTGTSPADANALSRNNVAAYVDVSTKPVQRWYIGVAGRFEHYDDSAGNTVSGKFSTRLDLGGGFALRGGVNSGFRAPSLAQTGFSTTQVTTAVIGSTPTTTISKFLPVNSVAAIALGARPLRPEKSLNYTAGLTFERGALHATVDAYQIRIDDRIVKTEFLGTSANGGSAIKAILLANGVSGVDSAQFFTNAVNTRTRGIDAVADYTIRSDAAGTFRLSAAYSYNRTRILAIAANPAVLAPLAVTLFGRQAQRDLEVALPHDKLVLSGDWSRDRLRASLRLTRWGSYIESSTSAAGDRAFAAKWITDVELGYDLTRRISLAIGADNLFDVYPSKNGLIAVDGSGAYGNFAPFGLTGGSYYGRVAIKL